MPLPTLSMWRRFARFASAAAAVTITGCTLPEYRQAADQEAYCVVSEKSNDPRWDAPDFSINIDPRSRYYDQYGPDCQPMPPDDPTAHTFMHCVDGKKGWAHWHCNGNRSELENPTWRDLLGEYVELTDNGAVQLTLDSALRLAYVHSPGYQQQLETVYLSALDVTTERFRFDTQFFGGNVTSQTHNGYLRSVLGETNTLSTTSTFDIQRRFATAGTMVVGFANSFVWQFAGPNTNSAFSIVNFNLVQPLLRGAGRDRALETLTRVERGLLGNLRELERYRQGFYTNVAVGNLGVGNVNRLGGFSGGTGLTGFSGTGQGGLGGVGSATGFGGGFFGGGAAGAGAGGGTGLAGGGAGQVGGFIGLLQSLQEIRNSQYSLDLQLRTLALLEANLDSGTIDLTQVDQFRQNIETLRAQLLQARAGLDTTLFDYKRNILGLPPDLELSLDDSFIQQFQLIDRDVTDLQNRITDFQDQLGAIPAMPDAEAIATAIDGAEQLLEEFHSQFEVTEEDIAYMKQQVPGREKHMEEANRESFASDVSTIEQDFGTRPARFDRLREELEELRKTSETEPDKAVRSFVGWIRRLSDEVQSLSLIQARARLESVVLEPVRIESPMAIAVARANRLDYMNNRSALVDSWRLIAFNADQLQSVLDVRLSGDVRTVGDNPVEFRGPTGTMTASLEFDAPLTRLLERNNYRQALIDYQQSRRRLIQYDDQIHASLLQRLTNLRQLETNLEIQRRAVVISIRRVDFTRAELNRPLPAAAPGEQASTFGPTAVQNLLSALSDLSNAQNNFMSVWLNYYSERMLLTRDLGLMQLDDEGRWIDIPLSELLAEACLEYEPVPPPVPEGWWDLHENVPDGALPNTDTNPSDEAGGEATKGLRSSDSEFQQVSANEPAEHAEPAESANTVRGLLRKVQARIHKVNR